MVDVVVSRRAVTRVDDTVPVGVYEKIGWAELRLDSHHVKVTPHAVFSDGLSALLADGDLRLDWLAGDRRLHQFGRLEEAPGAWRGGCFLGQDAKCGEGKEGG